MKKNIIIKAAVGVSAVATLFSLVTLIRTIIIGSNVAFPIIQVVGSAAILTVCILIFRSLSADSGGDEENDADDAAETIPETNDDETQAENAVDELYEKYNLSAFKDKKEKDAAE